MESETTSNPQQLRKRVALVVVLCGAIALVYFVVKNQHRAEAFDSLSLLAEYLDENGEWTVPKPPRDDWMPGTVLLVNDRSISTFLRSESLFPETVPRHQADAALPEFSVNLDSAESADAQFLAGRNQARLSDVSESRFQMSVQGAVIRYIERPTLLSTIRESSEIQEELANSGSQLFVITESLIANQMTIQMGVDNSVEGGGEVAFEESLSAELQGASRVVSESTVETTIPMVIGFKAVAVEAEATTLGTTSELNLRDLDSDELETIGEMDQLEEPEVEPVTHIHVLSIGLDRYPYLPDAHIGGRIPGAPDSARLVATRFRELLQHDDKSSVTLFAPSLTSDSFRDPVTKEMLLNEMSSWAHSIVQFAEDDETEEHALLVYFCGHGITNSLTGLALLVTEDVRLKEGSDDLLEGESLVDIREVTYSMLDELAFPSVLLLDCCRTDDGEYDRLVQRSSAPFVSDGPVRIANSMRRFWSRHGFYPTTVCIYSAVEGAETPTFPYTLGSEHVQIGPMAIVVDHFASDVIATPGKYRIGDLTEYLRDGVERDGHTLRGRLHIVGVREVAQEFYDAVAGLPMLREIGDSEPFDDVVAFSPVENMKGNGTTSESESGGVLDGVDEQLDTFNDAVGGFFRRAQEQEEAGDTGDDEIEDRP